MKVLSWLYASAKINRSICNILRLHTYFLLYFRVCKIDIFGRKPANVVS